MSSLTKTKERNVIMANEKDTLTVKKSDFETLTARLEALEKSLTAPAAVGGHIDPHGIGWKSSLEVHSASEDPNRKFIKENL